jgi:hypothetical protein
MLAAMLREDVEKDVGAAAPEPEPEELLQPSAASSSSAASSCSSSRAAGAPRPASAHPPPPALHLAATLGTLAALTPDEIVQKCVRDGVLATALQLYTSVGCADAPPEARGVFRQAEALFTTKSWAQAAELVEKAMVLGYPDATRCHNLLGVCYYWLGRDEDATTHLLQAQSAETQQSAAADRHELVDDTSHMVARLRSIVEGWFRKHSTDGRMSREQCAAFVRSCRHDQCQQDDERIVQLFASHDSNADGYLSLKDFLSIYREKARDPKGMQVVWQNLNAQGYGADLRPKLKSQHEPQLLLHIIGGTPERSGPTALHCTACNKTVTLTGTLADKSDQICPHPLFKVAICGGCFDRYMLSIVEPSSAVRKVTSCLYPDLLGGTEGKFSTGVDGRETCCRWCGEERAPETRVQCDACCKSICEGCILRNFGADELERVKGDKVQEGGWKCYCCDNSSLVEHQSWLMRLISCAASEKEEKRKRQNRRKRLRQKEKKRMDLPGTQQVPKDGADEPPSTAAKRTGLVSELPGADWSVLGPWRVTDWAGKVSKQTESLSSETYTVGERKWRVVLSGPSRNETGYVGLFLGCPEAPELLGSQNRARFILSIINQNADINSDNYDSQEYEHAFDETQDWGLTKFLDVATLESPANGFVKDDSILVAVYVQNLEDDKSCKECTLRLRRTDVEQEDAEPTVLRIRRDCKMQVLMDQFAKLDSAGLEGSAASYSSDLYKFTASGRPINPISTADELKLEDGSEICVRINTWKLEKEQERSRRKEEKAAEEERRKRRKESAIMNALKRKQGVQSTAASSKPKTTKAKSAKPAVATTEPVSSHQVEPHSPKSKDPADVVVVEVQDLSGQNTKFKIRRNQHLKKVSDWMESHRDQTVDKANEAGVRHRYLLNGLTEIDVNSTPDEIGLKESDVIHVAPVCSTEKSVQERASNVSTGSPASVVSVDSEANAEMDAQLERERRQRQEMQAEKQRLAREREEAAKVEQENRARANAEKRENVLKMQEAAAKRRMEERQRKKEARDRQVAARRAEKQRVAIVLQARARGAAERRSLSKKRDATIAIQLAWRQHANGVPNSDFRSASSSDSFASEQGPAFESRSSPVSPLWSPAKPVVSTARPTEADSAWTSTASVQHLADVPVEEFLSQLGLESSLRDVLAENEVDVEALALMAPDDFDELGIDQSAQGRIHGKLAELRDTTLPTGGVLPSPDATPLAQVAEPAALLRHFLRTDGMQCARMAPHDILAVFAEAASQLHGGGSGPVDHSVWGSP